jgi:hypothetical protein
MMKLKFTDEEYAGLTLLARIIDQTQGLIRNKRVKHEKGKYIISSSNCDPLLFGMLSSVLEMMRNHKALMAERILFQNASQETEEDN